MRRSIVLAATTMAVMAGLSSATGASAQAPPPDPFLIASPASGPVGTVVTLSGNSTFASGVCQAPMLNFIVTRSEFISAEPVVTWDQDGNFTSTVTIPSEYTSGSSGGTPPLTPGTVITFFLNCTQGPLAVDFTVTAPTTTTTPPTTAPPVFPPAEPPADADAFQGTLPGDTPPGGTVVIAEPGFEPGETVVVVLYSDPKVLATVEADVNGEVRIAVALPSDTTPGAHTLVLFGETQVRKAPLNVLALPAQVPGSTAATLPRTGPDRATGTSTGVAVVLLVAGSALVVLSSRRRGAA